jgi:hypothetical protein
MLRGIEQLAPLALCAMLVGGCVHTEPMPTSRPIGVSDIPHVTTTLYFGLGMADGSTDSQQAWAAFVDDEIATRFPNGFTILSGEGHWMTQAVNKREPSRVVIIVHPDTRWHSELVDVIRERYKALFHQESVLRVDEPAEYVCF